jgi:hypothetical protein
VERESKYTYLSAVLLNGVRFANSETRIIENADGLADLAAAGVTTDEGELDTSARLCARPGWRGCWQ